MYSTLGWWEEHSVLNWIMASWHHDMFDIKHYHCLTILLDVFQKHTKKTTILPWSWYFLNEKNNIWRKIAWISPCFTEAAPLAAYGNALANRPGISFSIQAGQQCNDAVLSIESGTCFTMKMDEHGWTLMNVDENGWNNWRFDGDIYFDMRYFFMGIWLIKWLLNCKTGKSPFLRCKPLKYAWAMASMANC